MSPVNNETMVTNLFKKECAPMIDVLKFLMINKNDNASKVEIFKNVVYNKKYNFHKVNNNDLVTIDTIISIIFSADIKEYAKDYVFNRIIQLRKNKNYKYRNMLDV